MPEPAEFTQKGATPSQGPPRLWERPGLSHVPPPTWPKTGSRLKPAWMYTLLGSSEVGLLGSNFQPPCGISIHNLPTQGRDIPTLQGPCSQSPKPRGSLRFLPPLEMRPSSIAPYRTRQHSSIVYTPKPWIPTVWRWGRDGDFTILSKPGRWKGEREREEASAPRLGLYVPFYTIFGNQPD